MAETVEIWVPIKTWPEPRSPFGYAYGPDIPADVASTTVGFTPDMTSDVRAQILSHFRIRVAAADAEKCTARVSEKDVPERDRMLSRMVEECAPDMTKAAAFFAGLTSDTQAKKDAIADVLAQAEARGMKKADADKVRTDKGISAAKELQ